ncbi:PREDICTED: uncharacterized protein LOC109359822 [Lupinus angustifolius]|uniref:uncharacterized protein LOC109359822 n=1 Tax=Lupinus angustifolius TaxID=3871 RepID=UPI00092EAB4E|nr:PREDICTED: uncharacterized protein LOC109359822 [Lupinus angustifolius]
MGQTEFPANLPILDEKNWNRWRIQMSAIMGFQEVSEIVEDGLPVLEKSTKLAWEILEKSNEGDEQLKKILRTLNPKFDHIVVPIEESKKIEELKVMDLQGSLEAHEQRILEISTEKDVDRALQAHAPRRRGYVNKGVQRKRSEKGRIQESVECQDDEPVLLMMEINNGSSSDGKWYIDSGCSYHMTRNRIWLINFDDQRKSSVRFAYSRTIQAKGNGDLLTNRRDGRKALIFDVLYFPNIKSNLLSLGQLLENVLFLQMHQGILEIFDAKNCKIMRVPLARNMSFQVNLKTVET